MKKIKLTCGKYALVDNKDYESLNKFKWCFAANYYGYGGYAVRRADGKVVRMHRIIIDAKKKEEVDHINRNKLDNRRRNLRIVSHSENMYNISLYKNNTSGFRGICWDKRFNKWMVRMGNKFCGYSKTLKGAILIRRESENKFQCS